MFIVKRLLALRVSVPLQLDHLIGNLRFQIGKIMYQYKAGLLPKCFDNIFLETNQVHSCNTRSSKSFLISNKYYAVFHSFSRA